MSLSTAITVCGDYSVNGYDDWYLPSKDELNSMFVNLHEQGRGGLLHEYYWSSSADGGSNAWTQYFANGVQYSLDQGSGCRVRAARKF